MSTPMRELRTCDFCSGDAAGTFELLPPELHPSEDEQRRVVLCSTCKVRLEDLLEPLLARAGVGGDGESINGDGTATDADVDTATDETAADEQPGDDGATRVGDRSTEEREQTREQERTKTETSTGDDEDDEAAVTLERTSERVRERESGSECESDSSSSSRSSSDAESDSTTEPESEANADATAETGITVEPTPAEGANDGTAPGDESRSRTATSRTTERPPRAYGKVIRLLRNREFPMERAAVESLAASAYDLETHEVEAIVDHALARDEFREESGQLYRA